MDEKDPFPFFYFLFFCILNFREKGERKKGHWTEHQESQVPASHLTFWVLVSSSVAQGGRTDLLQDVRLFTND